MMYLGVENKKPLGRWGGGGHIYVIRYLGGVRCVPLVFAFIKHTGQ